MCQPFIGVQMGDDGSRAGRTARRRLIAAALAVVLGLCTAGADSCDYESSGGIGTDGYEDTIGTPPPDRGDLAPPDGSDEIAPPDEPTTDETQGGGCEDGY